MSHLMLVTTTLCTNNFCDKTNAGPHVRIGVVSPYLYLICLGGLIWSGSCSLSLCDFLLVHLEWKLQLFLSLTVRPLARVCFLFLCSFPPTTQVQRSWKKENAHSIFYQTFYEATIYDGEFV